MRAALPLFLCLTALPAMASNAPIVFFSDITSGPNSGGDSQSGFAGAYVTLYGNFFGTSQGGSTVTLNGASSLRVVSWGTTYLWYQKIVVQLGSSSATGNFVVTTSAGASNNLAFTVRSGNIRCISTGGNDSNSGSFGSCWATPSNAITSMGAGDITYAEDGVSQTSATAFSAVVNIEGNPGGTSSNPIALVAYPGATVTIGALSAGLQYAIRIPQIGDSPAYYTIAGMTLRGDEALEIAGADHMRFIANDMSCDAATGFGCAHIDQSTNIFMYGNNLHDIGSQCASNSGNPTGAPCKFHGYYYTTNTIHVDHGWNILNQNPSGLLPATGYGVQFYSTGGTDQYDLHVHDSVFENNAGGCINFSTVNPDAGTVEAYNNVLYHCGTGPDPSGSAEAYYGVGTSAISAHTNPVLVYNNSFYDIGARGNVTNSNACVNATVPTQVTNNACQSTGAGEVYLSTNSGSIACSHFSGSNNDWYGNSTPLCTSNVTSNSNSDPQYTSLVSGSQNLLPTSGSPLFGAGTGASPTTDVTGAVRPSPLSIGAYEQASAGSPPTGRVSSGAGVRSARVQ